MIAPAMKAFLIAALELAVLAGIVVVVSIQPAALDRVLGMPSAHDRLLNAAAEGDEFLVDQALADGASIQARSADGSTALTHAAWCGHAALVERLIALGIDVNGGDNNGVTPLMYAALNDHDQVVRFLLARGGDPRVRASYAPLDAFDMAEKRMATRTLAVLHEWEQGAHKTAGAPAAQDEPRAPADEPR